MNPMPTLRLDLLRWSEGHALALIVMMLAIAAGAPSWLLSLCGLASFAVLLYRCRHRWTPSGRFGPANVVSLLRLCGVFVLPWLAPWQVVLCGVLLLVSDGVDGWIARRTGLAGEFGEFFDKESDAFFMLMLCLLLHRLPGGFGSWILLPGLLRYLFVLFVRVARPLTPQEQRSAKAGWISILMMVALLFSFAAYPGYLDYSRPLAALMMLVLAYSFAESLYLLNRAPQQREQT